MVCLSWWHDLGFLLLGLLVALGGLLCLMTLGLIASLLWRVMDLFCLIA